MKLLEGIVIVDFSQFLSGPSASLRLADLGARVIKIEKPRTGDICRQLYVSEIKLEGESTIFHTINRNKESFTADLKDEGDREVILKLISQADVVMHNFRPGVMEKLGLGYETIKSDYPQIIYAEISGYGDSGPWEKLPGQDLLLQSLTGLPHLNGNRNQPPTPMGVSVVDILAGTHLAQGILAALFRKDQTGEGALIHVSMLESSLDFQFEVYTTFLNDGEELPQRSSQNHAHAYVAAPYGVYQTADGFLILAMGNIQVLKDLLECPGLAPYQDPGKWFALRDEIKRILAAHLLTETTAYWLGILEPADIWCAEVLDFEKLMEEEGYQVLEMEMITKTSNGSEIKTTRCPIRINGEFLLSKKGAPFLGEHNDAISKEFNLK
ncbi:CaiB/BaiF CoA transferase family protein [Anditalea andensis]|uniref:Acyl-CoA transferase n=1 Tax=Anditalea andensis TaxID=1048983 RepID=A0A074L339_9BACT|nr:CaiB/BaiF CoA-transferase family protein [Anditalea andensis]KEO74288.1 acyl-CoA transferase [Anditalea andensis]